MSTATELLRRALESFDWMDVDNSVAGDIRAFLDVDPEAEPVGEIDGLARACNLAGIDYKDFLKIKAYMPIPPRPEPARKPMTEEELRKAFLSTNTAEPLCEGWPGLERFARAIEKHHGIGGDENG
jgi:hypothetical protein